jgi:hypothetical protein
MTSHSNTLSLTRPQDIPGKSFAFCMAFSWRESRPAVPALACAMVWRFGKSIWSCLDTAVKWWDQRWDVPKSCFLQNNSLENEAALNVEYVKVLFLEGTQPNAAVVWRYVTRGCNQLMADPWANVMRKALSRRLAGPCGIDSRFGEYVWIAESIGECLQFVRILW